MFFKKNVDTVVEKYQAAKTQLREKFVDTMFEMRDASAKGVSRAEAVKKDINLFIASKHEEIASINQALKEV